MTCWTVTIKAYNSDVTVQEMCISFTLLTQIRLDIRGTVKRYTVAMLNTELHGNMMKCDSFFHLFKFLLLNDSVNELHQFGSNCDILLSCIPTRCNVIQYSLLLSTLYMFQAVSPPIIRSSKLYTQHLVYVKHA